MLKERQSNLWHTTMRLSTKPAPTWPHFTCVISNDIKEITIADLTSARQLDADIRVNGDSWRNRDCPEACGRLWLEAFALKEPRHRDFLQN